MGVGKAPGQLLEQVSHQFLALLQVHQQAVGTRQEGVLDVQQRHLVRLVEALGHAVEVHEAVEADEAHLGAGVARHLVQMSVEHRTGGLQVAALLGNDRDVEEEQVHGRLRRTQHVLRGGNELDGAGAHLGPSGHVAVRFRGRIELEIIGHCNGKDKLFRVNASNSCNSCNLHSLTR